jgi:hypothetical protein
MATTSGIPRASIAGQVEGLMIRGRAGNDTLSSTGIGVEDAITRITLDGQEGDDTLTSGPTGASLYGGLGKNTLVGGSGPDALITQSTNDTVKPGSGLNYVTDLGLRIGGRTIVPTAGAQDRYRIEIGPTDAVVRSRPVVGPSTTVTASLTRTGQVTVGSTFERFSVTFMTNEKMNPRHLMDIVLTPDVEQWNLGTSGDNDLVDLTIPWGGWRENGTIGDDNYAIIPDHPDFGWVWIGATKLVSVHGPWTNANRGFAHRATRDLMFRFATSASLDTTQAALGSGAITRPQFTASLMNTDEYRGLDVDRVYLKYLDRSSDPGGRSSWITALRTGKSLLKFRGQLFGSNEYFTKAGGTNAAFVDAAYADVLGRAPDPSGRAYWIGRLDRGVDRGAVAIEFMNKTEPRRALVADQFLRFIDRRPTATEMTTWTSTLQSSSNGEQQMVAFLVNSSAYFTRT